MIDKMKECAAQYYKQQQDTIEEKNREITMLIENKNKEVSNVIQERKRSLDEKSKEVSKIVQEKKKETSKMTQALILTKEELESAKKNISDIERKNQILEDKLKEMIANTSEKSKQIMKLQNDKKEGYEKGVFQMDNIRKDREYEMEEKNKELKSMYNEHKKEVTQIMDNLLTAKKELSVAKEQLIKVQTVQKGYDNTLAQKEQEVRSLNKAVEETKKKNEFKSNIERSFESLQKQYQTKVDELERLKSQIGSEEKKRRTSNRS